MVKQLHQQQFRHKDHRTAGAGNGKQTRTENGQNDSHGKGNDSGDGGLGRLYNCREGHYGKRDIGHVIQKGFDEAVFNGLSDKSQR